MATFARYKNQVSINLDNIVYIKVDESMTGSKCAIRFHSVDGFEKHWECDSLEEVRALEDKIIELSNGVIDL